MHDDLAPSGPRASVPQAHLPHRYGRSIAPVRLPNCDAPNHLRICLMYSNLFDGQALAASASHTLALTGARITTLGERLKSRVASRATYTPASVAAAVLMLSMHPAMAQTAGGTGSLDTFLRNVADTMTGTTGTALAIIAVALCGIGAMFGALSMRAFGGVVLGCAIVFSAAWIVGKITGNAA